MPRGFGTDDGTKEIGSKFYRWGESAFQSRAGRQIKIVDDFNELAVVLRNQEDNLNS